jgi:hypothetical protein
VDSWSRHGIRSVPGLGEAGPTSEKTIIFRVDRRAGYEDRTAHCKIVYERERFNVLWNNALPNERGHRFEKTVKIKHILRIKCSPTRPKNKTFQTR